MEDLKSEIVFVNLPNGFESKFAHFHTHGDFKLDAAIPLPVEIPSGEAKIDDLTAESIVAGMLHVLGAPNLLDALSGTIASEAALRYYRNFVLAVRPHILEEFSNAALLKSKNGDFILARVILDALKALYPAESGAPSAASVFLLEAVILEDEADFYALRSAASCEGKDELLYQEAEKAYQNALSFEGSPPQALYNAGLFYKKRQDYGKAKEYLSEYLKYADEEREGALSKDDAKRKKETAELNIRVIEKRRLDNEHFHNAYTLIKAGKEEAGMKELRVFLEQHSDVWNAWFMLGWALRRLGRWQDAAAALRHALDLGGGKADTHNELAICLMELGELRAAKKELEAALIRDGENIKIISNLGVLCQKMGDTKAAEGFFRTVLELDGEDALAKNFFGS
jgi:Flp pilus assembly protein TadD